MVKFSGVISSGLPKVAQRFVQEMLYGIQAGQAVVLSEIGRCLEESVSLKKVEERLSWMQEGEASGARAAVVSFGGEGLRRKAIDGADDRAAQEESRGSSADAEELHQALVC